MCGGDSSSVMCVHTATRMELKQWENDVRLRSYYNCIYCRLVAVNGSSVNIRSIHL